MKLRQHDHQRQLPRRSALQWNSSNSSSKCPPRAYSSGRAVLCCLTRIGFLRSTFFADYGGVHFSVAPMDRLRHPVRPAALIKYARTWHFRANWRATISNLDAIPNLERGDTISNLGRIVQGGGDWQPRYRRRNISLLFTEG